MNTSEAPNIVTRVELEPLFDALEAQAKERQGTRTDLVEDNIPQIFAECKNKTENETRHKAAKTLGTNRQYISDAKKLKEKAPTIPHLGKYESLFRAWFELV